MNRMSKILKNNKVYIALFIASTSFFIYQHMINQQLWDFYAYLMNGKFWFHHGYYFELLRPPLAPLIIGLLGANLFAEYAYVVIISALFALSTYLLAKELKINEVIFYALLLNTSTLLFGLAEGTELLSMALIEVSILMILKDDFKSGIFLGLASLTRYTNLISTVIMFFHKDWKKIGLGLLIFLLTLTPWLLYNKLAFGNYFASMADSYALNVFSRKDISQPPKLFDFIVIGNILWVTFLMGLREFKFNRKDGIMLTLMFLTIISYLLTPLKTARYLFLVILPLAYFSSKIKISNNQAIVIFIVMLLVAFISQPRASKLNSTIYEIKELNLSHCELESNVWVLLNYYGFPTEPPVHGYEAQKEVEKGKILIEYKNIDEFANVTPLLYSNERYIIGGYKNCTKQKTPIIFSYIKQLNYDYKLVGYNENYSYCDIFFPRICKLVNKI